MTTSKKYEFEINAADECQRLDHFLNAQLPELSRSRIQTLIRTQLARVDGRPAKTGLALKAGMRVELEVPPPKTLSTQAQKIDLAIVHEDETLIVIDKPAGMVVHPAPGAHEGTLVNALLAHCGDLAGIGDALRPGIVHRLDKNTSGLLVVAKTEAALRALTKQIAARQMGREYLAVCLGKLDPPNGAIRAPVGRSSRDRKKMAVDPRRGRVAVTHYKTLLRNCGLSVIECRLETGRTHQIRVHLAHRNCPVCCDPEYGPKPKTLLAAIPKELTELRRRLAAIPHQLLHAHRLRLSHPNDGRELTFHAPPPEYFQAILELIAQTERSQSSCQ